MRSPSFFDVSPYLRVPNVEAPMLVTVAQQLLAVPDQFPAVAAIADGRLAVAQYTQALEELLQARLAAGGASTTAKADADAVSDRSWNAIYSVLDGKQQVPGPEQAPAARLFLQLFPEGRGWLNEKHEIQWAQADARLRLLGADRPGTTALLGKPLYDFVESAHADYGAALGIGPQAPAVTTVPRVLEATGDLRAALRDYALLVVSQVAFAADAAPAITAQLAPLMTLRARTRRALDPSSRSEGDDPSGPFAPPANG